MSKVSVIGIGNMGGAITKIAAAAGAQVQVVARDPEKAAALAGDTGATAVTFGAPLTGDIVVLAVPFSAVDEIVETYGPQLAGKVIVDITNPVDMSTFDGLAVPVDGSAASVLAAKLPDAKVLKAFNTNFAGSLATGVVGDQTTTVLVAGDDADAKAALIDLVRAGGLRAEDAGSLKRARELESIGFLQITLAVNQKVGWTGGFAVMK